MLDQYHRVLLQLAEARRMHGVNERDGTIDSVWRQDGEQKVRVNIGIRPDGSPWLTPWLKVEDHHGTTRRQRKWHKGMNVKVSTVGADLSQATVTPHGENQGHPEPDHADDYNETEQYARHRSRLGPDFAEHWLANQDQNYTQSNSTAETSDQGSQDQGQSQAQDPDQLAVVLVRLGQKPQSQQSQSQAWDGPAPSGGSPQKRYMVWAGSAGNVPQQLVDSILHQFNDKTLSRLEDGIITHQVGSQESSAAITQMLEGYILHGVGTDTWMQISTDTIRHLSDYAYMSANKLLHLDTPKILHLHGSPILTMPMILHNRDFPPQTEPGLDSMPFANEEELGTLGDDSDGIPDNPAYMSASLAASAPPTGDGLPFNGLRWLDSASSIEYVYYNGVWAEGGGSGTTFPSNPSIGQVYSYQAKQWKWNGTGWQFAPQALQSVTDDGLTLRIARNLVVAGDLTVDGNLFLLGNLYQGGTTFTKLLSSHLAPSTSFGAQASIWHPLPPTTLSASTAINSSFQDFIE